MLSEWVSVVVPFGGAGRLLHAGFVLRRLREGLDGRDEVVLVEQVGAGGEEYGRALASNAGVRYERLTRVGRFNRSACVNRGVDAAANKLVLVCDADCWKAPEYLDRVRVRVRPGVAVWGMVKRLGRVPTERVLGGGEAEFEALWSLGVPEPRGWGDAAGFMRCDWRGAGRYCEEFEGWGAEDDDFYERVKGVCRVAGKDRSLRSLHLWHEAPEGQAQDAACNAALLGRKLKEMG